MSGSDASELLGNLERVLEEADAVLAKLSTADLTAMRTIQGREISVLEAVYHVVEHFSMHMGQIIFIAKLHNPSAGSSTRTRAGSRNHSGRLSIADCQRVRERVAQSGWARTFVALATSP